MAESRAIRRAILTRGFSRTSLTGEAFADSLVVLLS